MVSEYKENLHERWGIEVLAVRSWSLVNLLVT